jgi:hypothetical protein
VSDDRLGELERRVDAIERRTAKRGAVEAELLKEALQYARLKLLQFYVDDKGFRVLVCHSDADMYAEDHLRNMQQLALALVRVAAS